MRVQDFAAQSGQFLGVRLLGFGIVVSDGLLFDL